MENSASAGVTKKKEQEPSDVQRCTHGDADTTTASVNTAKTTTTTRQKQMAKHRWKILRQAILKQKQNQAVDSTESTKNSTTISSTSVYDYQLLPPPLQVCISPNNHTDDDDHHHFNIDDDDDDGKQQEQQHQEKWKQLHKNLTTISPSFLLRQAEDKLQQQQQQQQQLKLHGNTNSTAAPAPSMMMMMTRTLVDELEVSILALLALEQHSNNTHQEQETMIDFNLVDDDSISEQQHPRFVMDQQEDTDLQQQQQHHLLHRTITANVQKEVFVIDCNFISKELEHCCGLEKCHVTLCMINKGQQQQQQQQILRVEYCKKMQPHKNEYAIHEYPLLFGGHQQHYDSSSSSLIPHRHDDDQHDNVARTTTNTASFSVYTRERVAHCLSLQELTSHRNQNERVGAGVDNTGNICIWDCEKTLVWAMMIQQQQQQEENNEQQLHHHHQHQHQQVIQDDEPTTRAATRARAPPHPRVILELGAGMAGLAALAAVGLLNRQEESSCKKEERNFHHHQQQQQQQHYGQTTPRHHHHTVYITDGHCNCIQNNRVNVRLMQAAGMIASAPTLSSPSPPPPPRHCSATVSGVVARDDINEPVTIRQEPVLVVAPSGNKKPLPTPSSLPRYVDVQCFQLKWTLDKVVDGGKSSMLLQQQADWTLVSDCTHFQNFHGELFWTMVRHTAVGGQILMCQPQRGTSLARFLQLVKTVNDDWQHQHPYQQQCGGSSAGAAATTTTTTEASPLLRVQEQSYPLLDEKHEHFLRHDTTLYRPNVHRPIILVLHKLREATEEDRLVIVRHIQDREQTTTTY